MVVGTAIYSAYQSTHEYTNAAKEMSEANDQNVASIEATSEKAEFYADQLDQLSEKENKTAQDKQLIQTYVDQLNKSVDGLNLTYDEEADKLSETTEAIHTKIDAMKQEALQAAYVKQSQEALDKSLKPHRRLMIRLQNRAMLAKSFRPTLHRHRENIMI